MSIFPVYVHGLPAHINDAGDAEAPWEEHRYPDGSEAGEVSWYHPL